jgi:hypothetical protein
MKPLIVAFVIGLLVAGAVLADEVYVPANQPSVGAGNYWPWDTSTSTEWRYQLLFTAQQLGNRAGLIHDIAFSPLKSGTHTSTNFEMTFSHTAASALVQTWAQNLPNPVVVYPNAPLTWNVIQDTWSPIGLQGKFLYNGTDNLVVDFRYFGGVMSGGFTGFCHGDGGTTTTIFRSWDNRSGAYSGTQAASYHRNLGLITRFTVDFISIIASGTTRPGSTVVLDLSAPADAGLPYQVGTSLGEGPTPIGSRTLKLSLDDLLLVTVNGWLPFLFQNYAGVLDAGGKARAAIAIVNDTRLVGTRLHTAFLTLDANAPFGVKSISDTFSFAITT